jgi:lysophospholipase L1-like esterase
MSFGTGWWMGSNTPGFGGGAGSAWLPAFTQSLAIIGDSRVQLGQWQWRRATVADTKGLAYNDSYTGNATATGSGTLEYRASDANVRWTAPGDTAGAWVPMIAGVFRAESASADMYLDVNIRNLTSLPGTDQTLTVAVSSSIATFETVARGFWCWAMHYQRWKQTPKCLGIGGNQSADVVAQLPWLETQAGGSGIDVMLLSTNDITVGTATQTVINNLTTIYDARRALGRKLILVGEYARWGVDAATPITAGQLTSLQAINAFQSSYAAANGCIYIDTYTGTVDGGFTDGRPRSGMLNDTVHPAQQGAQYIGGLLAAQLIAKAGTGTQRASGSAGNLLTNGYMSGTTGTISTGATGTAPTSWTVSRSAGADATVTATIVARSDGIAGNWMRLQCAATAGSQQIRAQHATVTLATAGLAVGDSAYIECEIVAQSMVNVNTVQIACQFIGATQGSYLYANRETQPSSGMDAAAATLRSIVGKIPPGTTGLRVELYVLPKASSTCDVRFASAAIVKVP